MGTDPQAILRDPAIREETRRIRKLQLMVRLTMNTLAEGRVGFEEASELVAATRRAALNLFPGKEEAFDLLYLPRLRRLLASRFRLQ